MNQNIIGSTVLGQFRIDSFVAAGGMGAVYRVWDLQRDVPLAMKVLHAELADDPAEFRRFEREARALQMLAHPHIVPFYGLYKTPDFVFLLERYIDGPSLKYILGKNKNQALYPLHALAILKAVTTALGYAHANGVVHCDVKPGNIMIDQGGNIFLTDFGIARHSESTTTSLVSAGTPAYMAPEQIRGEMVTAQTDVYALSVILFEMLTGRRPFRGNETESNSAGDSLSERIRYAHLQLHPPDPRSINPNIPEGLARAVIIGLSKQPDERYESAQQFFQEVCAGAGVTPEQVPTCLPEYSGSFSSIPPNQPPPISNTSTKPNRKMLPLLILGSLGMLFVAVLLGIYVFGSLLRERSVTPVVAYQAGSATNLAPDLIINYSPTQVLIQPSATLYPTYTPYPTLPPPPLPENTAPPQIVIVTATEDSPPISTTMSVEEFIRYYFTAINDRQYDISWSLLSDKFKSKNNGPDKGGYQGYVNWYQTVDFIDVLSVDVTSQTDTTATAVMDAVYHYRNGKVVNATGIKFNFKWDAASGTWQFHSP